MGVSRYHCIFHQEADFAQVIRWNHDCCFENFIKSRGLNQWQFKAFLEEFEDTVTAALYLTTVKWLSTDATLIFFYAPAIENGGAYSVTQVHMYVRPDLVSTH